MNTNRRLKRRRRSSVSRCGRLVGQPLDRRLYLEQLEDRRMLAIMVTNLDDAGAGSLRDAIAMANSPSSPGLDEIQFSVSGNLALTSGHLEITESLTITGPGQDSLTIDAQLNSRIFYTSGPNIDFTISGLTLTGGKTTASGVAGRGGAIRSRYFGTLTIEDSTITGNSTTAASADGGAIQAGGNVVLINSTVSESSTNSIYADGGGIFASGNVSLINSTVSGNSTALKGSTGGGIYADGNVTLTDSTVNGNSTAGEFADGGGIRSNGGVTLTSSTISGNSTAGFGSDGGGIFSNGAVTLTSSTVSGNSTTGYIGDGGGIHSYGDVTLTSSTITDNHVHDFSAHGGGIWNNSDPITITLTNSIVAGNTAGDGSPDMRPGTGSLDVDYSLIGNTSGLSPSQLADINAGIGNELNKSALLGPLAFNGGPTETHAPLFDSLVIDAGDPAIAPNPIVFDQRGAPFVRVVNGAGGLRIDMGAYERQTVLGLNLEVDTTSDDNDDDHSSGNFSLREAVGLANGSIGADTITFDSTVFANSQVISLALGEIEITDTLTIEGPGQNLLTIDAQQQSRIFDSSTPNVDFTISGLTLTGGRTTDSGIPGRGGAIRSRYFGTLTIDQSTITGNSTANNSADGGAILAGGDVVLSNSTVSGNSTAGDFADGGAFFSYGNVMIANSTISGNSTGGQDSDGGGILAQGAVTITDSTLSGNSTNGANSDGGAIRMYTDPLTIEQSTISGNTTDGSGAHGGAILTIGNIEVTYSTVTDNHANHATATGGGIWNNDDLIIIDNSILSGNTAGGGMNDISPGTGFFFANFSLIGTLVVPNSPLGIIKSDNPMLGPLANNGGTTETHAPLTGSSVIDTGNPIFTAPPDFDQRGAPFARVSGGRIDMGAVEVQQAVPDSADFDTDGDIDGADFLAWQRGFGTPGADKPDGDADNDNDVDGVDLGIWESQFGQPAPVAAAGKMSAISAQPSAKLIDAAMALVRDDQVAETSALDEESAFAGTFADHAFATEAIAPAVVFADDNERRDTSSSEDDVDETPWLADELLERVFG